MKKFLVLLVTVTLLMALGAVCRAEGINADYKTAHEFLNINVTDVVFFEVRNLKSGEVFTKEQIDKGFADMGALHQIKVWSVGPYAVFADLERDSGHSSYQDTSFTGHSSLSSAPGITPRNDENPWDDMNKTPFKIKVVCQYTNNGAESDINDWYHIDKANEWDYNGATWKQIFHGKNTAKNPGHKFDLFNLRYGIDLSRIEEISSGVYQVYAQYMVLEI